MTGGRDERPGPPGRLTVVVPTHGRPALVRRALASIDAQLGGGDVEVLVVHDREPIDPTLASAVPRHRVRVLRNERTPGLAGARNTGILAASTPFVAFLDDDDEWLPGKLAAQLPTLQADPRVVAATCGIEIRAGDRRRVRIPERDRLTYDGFLLDRMTEVHPSTLVVRRAALVAIGMVDESLPGSYAEDYDLLLRLCTAGGLAVVAEPLTIVHWHRASFFAERWRTIDEALEHLLAAHPGFSGCPRGLARVRGQQAFASAACGDRRRALRLAAEATRLDWRQRRSALALAVAAGLPAGAVLRAAQATGRGI
jgi:glycosyltransferase involved in cell wall biosynthesis